MSRLDEIKAIATSVARSDPCDCDTCFLLGLLAAYEELIEEGFDESQDESHCEWLRRRSGTLAKLLKLKGAKQ